MAHWYDIIPISQVDHRLFVSGYAEANNLNHVNPHKISAVLDVHQTPDEHQNPDIIYMHIPFEDGEEIPQRQFVKCLGWLKFMHEAGHNILIHCAAGISRSVTITAAFMHYAGICDFNEAIERIKSARPIANPAPKTMLSAKRMLGVWPYDGTADSSPEHEKMVHDSFQWMDAARAALAHPSQDCPMKQFLLHEPDSNRPRHEIPCTCEKLMLSTDASNKTRIFVASQCITCGKGPAECQCFDGYVS
jgi:protein-tyrosine phosphatase